MKYRPKTELWEHQRDAWTKLHGKKVFALLMAMRTGKSPVVLADFGQMVTLALVTDLAIIGPGGVYRTWQTAIEEHVNEELAKKLAIHIWTAGAGVIAQRHRTVFMENVARRPRILLMNIEALSKPGPARDLLLEFLQQNPGKNMLVIDESTTIKNMESKRTMFINNIVRPLASYRRILSGLATPKSLLDLFSQMEFLDWKILGFRSYYAFRSHVAIMKTEYVHKPLFGANGKPMRDENGKIIMARQKYQVVDEFKNDAAAEVQKLIAPYSFRVPFRPQVPSTYSIREVTLTKEQRKAYNEIREEAITILSNAAVIKAKNVISQILRLHQVLCGHVKDINDVVQQLPENRTQELLQLLEDYDGKAIIWCSYLADIARIKAALEMAYGPGSVAVFSGANVQTRETEEYNFLKTPICRFMLSTQAAGGRGRTWSNADLVIYYSSTDNLEYRDQSEQRALGVKKDRGVDYVDLIVPDTVEMKILNALKRKIDMAAAINADNWRSWVI